MKAVQKRSKNTLLEEEQKIKRREGGYVILLLNRRDMSFICLRLPSGRKELIAKCMGSIALKDGAPQPAAPFTVTLSGNDSHARRMRSNPEVSPQTKSADTSTNTSTNTNESAMDSLSQSLALSDQFDGMSCFAHCLWHKLCALYYGCGL